MAIQTIKSSVSVADKVWGFDHGIPADLWTVNADIVKTIIEEKGYKPDTQRATQFRVGAPATRAVGKSATEKISDEQAYVDWWMKAGGIRVPHLHYNGELYLLNKKQWNEFSGEILKEFSKKLAEAKTVNFGQLMQLSEAINEII